MKFEKFTFHYLSDIDYEKLITDILYEEKTVMTITQDEGIDHMNVILYTKCDVNNSWKFPLEGFIQAINFGKDSLIETLKFPEN